MMESGIGSYGVVLVTVATIEEAKTIAQSLLEAKLAACVNIFPMSSMYLWQGKIDSDREYQLIIKTDLNKFSQLSEQIKACHSYEVPEIIALPIVAGSDSYLAWLGGCLN